MYNTALHLGQVADIQYFARMAELVDALDSKCEFETLVVGCNRINTGQNEETHQV